MANVYERIFKKVKKIIDTHPTDDHFKLHASGYMDLTVERIGENTISLTHYYEENGDLVADPDMTVKLDEEYQVAFSLTYQQDALGIYQEVYPVIDGRKMTNLRLQKELNSFLDKWLTNLRKQGFYK